ncbi:Acyl-CoA-binding domain-containing protein 5 [Holothuria leucospilota]|uniref:Acyl-CoA-binding domain-containing protein 5 n=1 Tax=Holothuria leucospilota TaxID=206669 RepID=A0A9Q1C0V1_HOLLE|nr:Acyl-CoA-binding domain-containing protein 5 [Holothuria leucospilota]
MATVEEKFTAAVQAIKKLPKDGPFQPSYDMMKRFYGLFKQATEGPCTEARPAFWNAIKKAKWEAWSCLGDMPKTQAQEEYVNEMLKVMIVNFKADDVNHMVHIIETMPQTDEVRNFLRIMGPFFETVTVKEEDIQKSKALPNGDLHLHNGDTNSHENGDSLEASPEINGTDEVLKGRVPPPDQGTADSSHPIFVDEEEHHDLAGDEASSSSGTEDEFCDSMDQPDISVERKVRFADTEQLPVVIESQPLTSTPVAGDRITTEAEVHSIPTDGSHQNSSQRYKKYDGVKRTVSPKSTMTSPNSAGDSQQYGGRSPAPDEMSEHIAIVLERLQRDMNSVLVRLNSLETLALTRHQLEAQGAVGQDSPSRQVKDKKSSWWPLSNLSMQTVFFILVWPFVVNWILKFLRRRRYPRN